MVTLDAWEIGCRWVGADLLQLEAMPVNGLIEIRLTAAAGHGVTIRMISTCGGPELRRSGDYIYMYKL